MINATFKNFIKEVLPPIIIKIYHRRYFDGKYLNWASAKSHSTGYNNDNIFEKVKNASLKVKNGEAAFERDSVIFDKIEYSWPLLASLLLIATKNSNSLNLIDFGGSLGSIYFQNQAFFNHLEQLSWNIVEQEKFVECGKEYFEDKNLKFFYNIDSCFIANSPSTVLFSGVMQYLEKPYELLEQLINKKIKYIIIDRTPFQDAKKDILTIQKVPKKIYNASYPCWLFSRDNFLSYLNNNYKLIFNFDSIDTLEFKGAEIKYEGYLFELK